MLTRQICKYSTGFTILIIVVLGLAIPSTLLMADEHDIIGVYFDEAGTETTDTTTEPYESVPAYVAVKNMTASSCFAGIYVRLTINGVAAGWVSSLIGSQNMAMFNGEMLFSAEPHIAPQDLILIGSTGGLAISSCHRIEFHITPFGDEWDLSFPTPMYHTTDGLVYPLTPSSGSYEAPVAVINPDATLANEESSWGRIKTLYH